MIALNCPEQPGMAGNWVVMHCPPWPAWKCRAFAADDGRVFLPAAVWGKPTAIVWCATCDRSTIVWFARQPYVESRWLATVWCPEHAAAIAQVVARVEDATDGVDAADAADGEW